MTKTKHYSYIILVYLSSLLKRIVKVVFISNLGNCLVHERNLAPCYTFLSHVMNSCMIGVPVWLAHVSVPRSLGQVEPNLTANLLCVLETVYEP